MVLAHTQQVQDELTRVDLATLVSVNHVED